MSSPRKFRVWDGEEMHEPPHDFQVRGNGSLYVPIHIRMRPGRSHIQDGYEVLFSTGLTDAEGNEIWEGDIVEDKYVNTGVVKWAEGDSCWGMAIYRAPDQTTAEQKLTVIGNRYQNPELLKETG